MNDNRFAEEQCDIIFEDAAVVGNRICFPAWNVNGLFSMDTDLVEVGFECIFPFEHLCAQRLFGCICCNGDSLFLGPHEGDSFYEFRISDRSLHKMMLPEWLNQKHYSFTISFSYKEYVYFAGAFFPGILRYCPEEERWENIDGWVFEVNRNQIYDGPFFVKGACILDGVAYLACAKAEYVLAIYLDEADWNLVRLGEEGHCYSDICCDGNNIWLAPKVFGQPVIVWNPKDGKRTSYQFPWHRLGEKGVRYFHWRISYAGQRIWLFPVAPGVDMGVAFIVGISISDGEVRMIDVPVTGEKGVSSWLVFRDGEKVLFSDMKTENLFALSAENEEVERLALKWNLWAYMLYEGCKMVNANQGNHLENIWKETGKYSLPVLLSEIEKKASKDISRERHVCLGRRIHTEIMNDIM